MKTLTQRTPTMEPSRGEGRENTSTNRGWTFCACSLILALLTGFYTPTQGAQYKLDSLTVKAVAAIELSTGSKGAIDPRAAYNSLLELANQGHPMSMNALGRLLMEGLGCTQDTNAGLAWLNKAADAGYYGSLHNLGTIYKYGRSGVKQDFEICFYYFDKLAKTSCALQYLGLYDAGFMLYKGLGCTQSYQKAFEYFKLGAERNFPPCMYMLALCYRNGYGTIQDVGKGSYWLTQAIREGYSPAVDEYYTTSPENTPIRMIAKSAVKSTTAQGRSKVNTNLSPAPEQIPHIPHMRDIQTNALDGTYEGMLVTYDWSGSTVLKETPLTLVITTDKENCVAEWCEQGSDTITVKGKWKDTGLTFIDAQQGRSGHYDARKAILWNFTDAQLQLLADDSVSYLVGNLQMFSPQTMEPNQPMYINLVKTSKATTAITTPSGFYVYPNPFSDGLNISFFQQKETAVTVTINKTSGEKVFEQSLGKYAQGQQDITLPLNLASGVYLLRLITGSKAHQTIVIKK